MPKAMTLNQENLDDGMVYCKPLLKWPGAKTGVLLEIVPRIPDHNRYFEPFSGGGSVYFDAIKNPSSANDATLI